MKRKRNLWGASTITCVLGVAAFILTLIVPLSTSAQNPTNPNDNVGPFDFANSFYMQNGVRLSSLASPGGRVGVDSNGNPCMQTAPTPNPACNSGAFGAPVTLNWVTDTTNTDPVRTSARLLQTTGGFNKDGNLIFYSIFATLNDDSFFDDTDCPTNPADPTKDFTGCGTRAKTLANQFRAFIQPKQFKSGQLNFPGSGCTTVDTEVNFPPGIQPIVVNSGCLSTTTGITFGPPPGNRRQDNVFDTQPTYFCQDLLGLWILTFTVYTPNAYTSSGQYASAAAQAAISPIAAANGTNLDGTAVLERTSEVDSLTQQGYLEQLVMPTAAHSGAPRYVV